MWLLDYDGALLMRFPAEETDAFLAGGFYKLYLRRYVKEALPGFLRFKPALTYIKRGQSVVLYNHRPRKQREQYFAEIAERLNAASMGKPFMAITFPKGSVRDYFLIPANDEHSKHMKTALTDLVSGPWGQLGLCKFE